MNRLKIGDDLMSNYADYYKDGDVEWRCIGANGQS